MKFHSSCEMRVSKHNDDDVERRRNEMILENRNRASSKNVLLIRRKL